MQHEHKHEVSVVRSRADKQICFAIRMTVFYDEQRFPISTEFDKYDDDQNTGHLLLRIKDAEQTAVGTIRAVRLSHSVFKLTRLAILKDYRKCGFGSILVNALHDFAKQQANCGPDEPPLRIVCHSQIHAKPFYTKFGYKSVGEEFDEDGEPHQEMVLQLS
ncbi:acyl-CoA N-acyltransferase [Fistulina hepatica ATCC 64428]|nr:acyl-CoA N-acyltransferase [Fistulina hepatica ATCC 64428]